MVYYAPIVFSQLKIKRYVSLSRYKLIGITNDPLGTHIIGIARLVWQDNSCTISLLADLYVLSFHGLSEHENEENMYRQLTTDFFSLDRIRNFIIISYHQPLILYIF